MRRKLLKVRRKARGAGPMVVFYSDEHLEDVVTRGSLQVRHDIKAAQSNGNLNFL